MRLSFLFSEVRATNLTALNIQTAVQMQEKSSRRNSGFEPVGADDLPHGGSSYRVVCASACLLRKVGPRTESMLPDKDGPALGGGQTSENEDPSVSLFREYLRLRTVHPEPDYGKTPAVTLVGFAWLKCAW